MTTEAWDDLQVATMENDSIGNEAPVKILWNKYVQ